MLPCIFTSAKFALHKFLLIFPRRHAGSQEDVGRAVECIWSRMKFSGVEGLKQNKHFPTYFVCQSQLCEDPGWAGPEPSSVLTTGANRGKHR